MPWQPFSIFRKMTIAWCFSRPLAFRWCMIRQDRSQNHRGDVNQVFKKTKISLFKYRYHGQGKWLISVFLPWEMDIFGPSCSQKQPYLSILRARLPDLDHFPYCFSHGKCAIFGSLYKSYWSPYWICTHEINCYRRKNGPKDQVTVALWQWVGKYLLKCISRCNMGVLALYICPPLKWAAGFELPPSASMPMPSMPCAWVNAFPQGTFTCIMPKK